MLDIKLLQGYLIHFKLDTGSDITVVIISPIIQKRNKQLYGPGYHQIIVISHVEALLETPKEKFKHDLFIIDNLRKS